MFTSPSQFHTRNNKDAALFNAYPAKLMQPAGGKEPGVVLMKGKAIRAVMPVSEALRLANEIADSIAAAKAGS
ncbi:hypothetical protein J2T22_000624 [Pseudarthrobacter defluvii]|uniref:Uncharacterized protein n=1 Tax=Pseudarthrobacter defluvii TaxID=410837 RepID=A0ABT9UCS9_9MICC|nr:hypothetical protein [Pseudarthrobacter defluvii]MDQ0117454.1 hypothetical protein [Pseudarthrobacter defluvii]